MDSVSWAPNTSSQAFGDGDTQTCVLARSISGFEKHQLIHGIDHRSNFAVGTVDLRKEDRKSAAGFMIAAERAKT
jgi:hypothetical protein